MAYDFPASPTNGQQYTPSGGPTYQWNGTVWTLAASLVIPDAPSDGSFYGRVNATWAVGASKAYIDAADALKVTTTAEARNRIVNPAMQISQENGNTAGTVAGYYAADQWSYYFVASGAAIAHLRGTGFISPRGSPYRLRINVNTPKPSLGASDYVEWLHAIEGGNVADFNWGTATAKPIVLRFGIRAPAGTYSIVIRNSALTRSYVKAFTISAGQANLETEIVLAIPGDTAGAWLTDTGVGMYIGFFIAAGTALLAPVEGWQAGNFFGLTGMTNGIGAANSFELFDVGLYRDPNNTGREPAWQFPNEADELIRCKRYWQLVTSYLSTALTPGASGMLPVQMRIVPTWTRISGAGTGGAISGDNIYFYQSVVNSAAATVTFALNART